MMKRKTGSGSERAFKKRVDNYLFLFSKEDPQIREQIAKDLPAYNEVLATQSESFEQIALRIFAEKQGVIYDKNNPPAPSCPFCGSNEKVHKKEDNIYLCRSCNNLPTFSANYNSISSGTKCTSVTWMKLLRCLLDGYSITRTCDYCDISETTYYNLRNRMFYAMQLLMSRMRLYGLIQVDNTFVRVNYKGYDLTIYDYAEDSMFVDDTFKPRAANKRGRPSSNEEKNANSICIFCAIDDHGHAIARFVDIGAVSYSRLLQNVPKDVFLTSVPEIDPFDYLIKDKEKNPITAPNDPSLMISDKEGAIISYAKAIGMPIEAHKFRDNHGQRKLSASSHDIQKANALHYRLKKFLSKYNYVSSKYLPGFLTLFEFVECTGASREAIKALFEILATPNLGESAAFFKDFFTVPNYLLEWLDNKNPLSKIPQSKITAFYMYEQYKHPEDHPYATITMEDIERETGYRPATVRKNYRDLVNAGYRDMIISAYKGQEKKIAKRLNKGKEQMQAQIQLPSQNKKYYSSKTFNPTILAIYDEFAANRMLPKGQSIGLQKFLDNVNKKYGTNYTRTNIQMKFKEIVKKGIREPMPESPYDIRPIDEHGKIPSQQEFDVLSSYMSLVSEFRKRGEKLPKVSVLHTIVGEQFGLSAETVRIYLTRVRVYKKKKGENFRED